VGVAPTPLFGPLLKIGSWTNNMKLDFDAFGTAKTARQVGLPSIKSRASIITKSKVLRTKTPHGLDGQHQYLDRTIRRKVNQNDRGQI